MAAAIRTTLLPLNKTIKTMENLSNIYIKNKHTRIIKHKEMTLTVQKLEEIHANLWGSYDPLSILKKSYVGLLLVEYMQKSWVLLLKSKD